MFTRWIDMPTKRSVLLLGPRRSGKTTLLKHRFPDYAYATLDDLDNLGWARSDPKGFVQSLGKKAIIDEIQRHPVLTVAVKYAIDEEHSRFFMTGSSSAGLLDASADSLAGRIDIRALTTACWGEDSGPPTHQVFEEEAPLMQRKLAQRQLADAKQFGQFPEVLTAATAQDKMEILRNYRDTYFTRDLMMLSNLENLDGLMVLYHHVSRSIGSLLETSNLAREAGISFPTAKKYLNSLVQSQLVFRLTGYQYGPAKRYVKASKVYPADMGIVTAFGTPLAVGQQMENFVIAELEKLRDEDKLYFTQEITDEVIGYVKGHPEISGGVRDENIIYETKIPYMAKEYLPETDERMKRYYYCHCAWVRESLRTGDVNVSPTFCYCSAGFHKRPYEVIFGQPLRAEVIDTVLDGGTCCRFAIHLPEDSV